MLRKGIKPRVRSNTVRHSLAERTAEVCLHCPDARAQRKLTVSGSVMTCHGKHPYRIPGDRLGTKLPIGLQTRSLPVSARLWRTVFDHTHVVVLPYVTRGAEFDKCRARARLSLRALSDTGSKVIQVTLGAEGGDLGTRLSVDSLCIYMSRNPTSTPFI